MIHHSCKPWSPQTDAAHDNTEGFCGGEGGGDLTIKVIRFFTLFDQVQCVFLSIYLRNAPTKHPKPHVQFRFYFNFMFDTTLLCSSHDLLTA